MTNVGVGKCLRGLGGWMRERAFGAAQGARCDERRKGGAYDPGNLFHANHNIKPA